MSASKIVDITGPVNATTAYCSGSLVARNVKIALPEVTHVLGTIQTALGEQEIPLYGLIESMEASITKIGCDLGLAKMCTLQHRTMEFRWVQQTTLTSGKTKQQGCKAFLRTAPKTFPAIEVEPGSSVEAEIPLSVTRYQLYVDGKEILLVDKIAGICRIYGTNYAKKINSLL